ncbi:MAG: tetraacyldisaccharide 4'-kinase [Phycisphaerales bacterium]
MTTSARAESRSGAIPGAIGRALATAYEREIGRRNRRYDAGVGVVHVGRPVISVGNLSVGGTGKTPLVTWIVRRLLDEGRRPCIAMRGYRAKGGIADEAAIYRKRFLDLPIVAQPDRTKGLEELFATSEGRGVDCVVLDDGFQHRRIARDLDIVLVDATRSPFEDALLPSGWLREPVTSLERAGAVVITHAEHASDRVETLRAQVGELAPGVSIGVTRHEWTGLDVQRHTEDEDLPLEWLEGQKALAVCAIGNPDAFLAEAERLLGDRLVGAVTLRDHDRYERGTVHRLMRRARSSGADVILTTEKDWVKLARVPAAEWPCSVARPRLELSFDEGGETLATLVSEAAGVGVGAQRP